jgi:hypothetical protein
LSELIIKLLWDSELLIIRALKIFTISAGLASPLIKENKPNK